MPNLLKLSIALFILSIYFSTTANSQNQSTSTPVFRTCSTDEIHQDKMNNDPIYRKYYLERQAHFRNAMNNTPNQLTAVLCPDPVMIPMAVHFQNISNPDAACLITLAQDQVQILNDDYQGLNADITNWVNDASSYFPGVSNGESCIEFCIATQNHPTGYGINDGDPAITINQFSGDSNSDWSGYINVFVRNIGPLGYSPLGGSGNGDGVTIDVGAFGAGAGCTGVVPGAPYDLGRTLTHELGHYLNLNHIWGGGCGNDDGVGDTPDSDEPWFGCPANGVQTCNTNDMHMSYMDYTNDACMYMFSADQSTIMENYVASNLGNVTGNSNVCEAPGPTISFTNASTIIDEGTSNCNTAGTKTITLILKIGAAPSANAIVSFLKTGSATDSDDYYINPPQVTFPAGLTDDQTVSVTIYEDAEVEADENMQLSYTINSNGGDAIAGSSNQTHTVDIKNDDNVPSPNITVTILSQDFNDGLGSWTVNDGGSTTDTWELTTGYNGSGTLDGSQFIMADSDAPGNGSTMNEVLFSPVFDGTGVTGLTLEFDQYINIYDGVGDFDETFDVDIWNGSSWQNVYHHDESDQDLGNWSAPNQQSINISTYANANNQLRFTYIAEWDWWWALDNILVTGTDQQGIQTAENSSNGYVDYELGPMSTIHFYDEDNGNLMLTLENNTAFNYGCTHVEIDRGAGSPPGASLCTAPESEYVTDKTFKIIPEFNDPTGNYSISLYYTSEEISGWASACGHPESVLEMVKSATTIAGASTVEIAPVAVSSFGSNFIYTATFNTGFSGFALGNPVNPLPVELTKLAAIPIDDAILVQWSTASEVNNRGFELLRSTSPENGFELISWTEGNGNSSTDQNYRYNDQKIVPGQRYYYQLNQLDYDGLATLSNIVSAETERKSMQIDIHPNPIHSFMTLSINSPSSGSISIYHTNGKVIERQPYDAGNKTIIFDMRGYPKGIYLVAIQSAGDRIVKKVIKSRD